MLCTPVQGYIVDTNSSSGAGRQQRSSSPCQHTDCQEVPVCGPQQPRSRRCIHQPCAGHQHRGPVLQHPHSCAQHTCCAAVPRRPTRPPGCCADAAATVKLDRWQQSSHHLWVCTLQSRWPQQAAAVARSHGAETGSPTKPNNTSCRGVPSTHGSRRIRQQQLRQQRQQQQQQQRCVDQQEARSVCLGRLVPEH